MSKKLNKNVETYLESIEGLNGYKLIDEHTLILDFSEQQTISELSKIDSDIYNITEKHNNNSDYVVLVYISDLTY